MLQYTLAWEYVLRRLSTSCGFDNYDLFEKEFLKEAANLGYTLGSDEIADLANDLYKKF